MPMGKERSRLVNVLLSLLLDKPGLVNALRTWGRTGLDLLMPLRVERHELVNTLETGHA